MTMDIDMEDHRENDAKTKVVDNQGGTSAAAASEYIDLREKIKKHLKFIRYYLESSLELNNRVEAIRDLKGILSIDKKRHAEVMVGERVVSVLIQQLGITSRFSGDDGDSVPEGIDILEVCALSVLKSLARGSESARRAIIEEGAIPHFLCLLRRKHRHADNELRIRIHRGVLKILGVLPPEDAVNAVVADENHDARDFLGALASPDHRVQLLALKMIRAFASENAMLRPFASENAPYSFRKLLKCFRILIGQLMVMLSSKHVQVRRDSASTFLALYLGLPPMNSMISEAGEAVVRMLDSSDSECRSLAAQLLTSFATANSADRQWLLLFGALRPLVGMLNSPNLQRDAVFAIQSFADVLEIGEKRRLGEGIIMEGGLQVLTDLFFSPEVQNDPGYAPAVGSVFHTVVSNQEGTILFIKMGGLRLLRKTQLANDTCRLQTATSLLSFIYRNINHTFGHVVRSLVHSIKEADDSIVRARCVYALAIFAHPYLYRDIFVFNNCLEILLELYASPDPDDQFEGAEALYNIAFSYVVDDEHDTLRVDNGFFLALNRMEPAPVPLLFPVPDKHVINSNYDVTFLLDDSTRQLMAHKRVLREASDVFGALLSDNGFFKDAAHGVIEVPNAKYSTFKSVMEFIYTGRLPVRVDEAYDILQLADFYNLTSLHYICQLLISREDLLVERVAHLYEFAEKFRAKLLMHGCILFILEYHEQVRSLPWYPDLLQAIIPEIRQWFSTIFNPRPHDPSIILPDGL